MWCCSIISFPGLLTLGTYTGTLYLRGGTYNSLGFISIHISGITTANAIALGYQQVSLTLLLIGTSNPARLFLLQAIPMLGVTGQCVWMRIWRESSGDLLQPYSSRSRRLWIQSPMMLECQHWSSAKEVRRTTPWPLQWKCRPLSLSLLPRFLGIVVTYAPGAWVVYNMPPTLKPLLVLLHQKLPLTALCSICLPWKTVVFAAVSHFIFSMVLASPTGL